MITRRLFGISALLSVCFLSQPIFALFSTIDNSDTRFVGWKILHIPSRQSSKIKGTKPKKFTYKLPATNTVYVAGNINLTIVGNQACNKLIICNTYTGRNADIKFYEGSLYLGNTSARASSYAPREKVNAILYVSNLRRLFLSGSNCVTGNNIADYCGFELTTCGSGSVCLIGPTHIKRIVNTGNTVIDIPQVTTEHLHIVNTCAGRITLGGCANLLLIRAFGNTSIDGRCLRSHTAYIQASHNALVLVRVRQSLRAFASGAANIYYYTTPLEIVKHTRDSANIFQFASWCD